MELTSHAKHNVGNSERLVSIVGGAAMAAYGLARRSKGGLTLAGLGSVLLWRGATGVCPVYKTAGRSHR